MSHSSLPPTVRPCASTLIALLWPLWHMWWCKTSFRHPGSPGKGPRLSGRDLAFDGLNQTTAFKGLVVVLSRLSATWTQFLRRWGSLCTLERTFATSERTQRGSIHCFALQTVTFDVIRSTHAATHTTTPPQQRIVRKQIHIRLRTQRLGHTGTESGFRDKDKWWCSLLVNHSLRSLPALLYFLGGVSPQGHRPQMTQSLHKPTVDRADSKLKSIHTAESLVIKPFKLSLSLSFIR